MSPEGQADFKSVSEAEEKLDYDRLKPCSNCKKPIAHDATICYFCGQDVNRQSKAPWAGWIAAALIIIFILTILLSLIG